MKGANPMVAILLEKMAKKGGGEKPKGEDMPEGHLAAAEEAMAAMKDGDASAFASAMKSLVKQCMSDDYEDD